VSKRGRVVRVGYWNAVILAVVLLLGTATASYAGDDATNKPGSGDATGSATTGTGNDDKGNGLNGVGIDSTAALSAAISSLSIVDQQQLKVKCLDVLAAPAMHPSNIVTLCKLIGKL
jgi:hypothetical protein